MPSDAEQSLCFVSWNTRGIKGTKKFPRKLSDISCILNEHRADIVFLQETHVGPTCYQILDFARDWRVFFTVHNSRSKGVAILISNTVQFEYIDHDEDCSGGYFVLVCRLFGELYTLVNVYNHHKDKTVLMSLKDYLTETNQGLLIVGGDFNTVLNPTVDRNPSKPKENPKLRALLIDFTETLRIQDTWSSIHTDPVSPERFTREQSGTRSRLDMFYLQERTVGQVESIEVRKEVKISDHDPLVLRLRIQMQTSETNANNSTVNGDYTPDWSPGKISGAEILRAVKSLTDRKKTINMKDYKTRFSTLKSDYKTILNTLKVPEDFKHSQGVFTMEYWIFSEILSKRLSSFIPCESNTCSTVEFEGAQEIKWSYLRTILVKLTLHHEQKGSKQATFVPTKNWTQILDCLLPKVQSSSEDIRYLHLECSLTSAILKLALKQLDNMLQNFNPRIRHYNKQGLPMHNQQDKCKQCIQQVFQDDSGLKIKIK